MIDYYEILEVSPKASTEVIKVAYRALLHRYNLEHDSEDRGEVHKLDHLNLAYDVLSDPDKREAFDQRRNKAIGNLKEVEKTLLPSQLATENTRTSMQVNSNQVVNNPSILARLKWNRWGWVVSILAVLIVLISMVQPDPEQALQGQAAVKASLEKKELEGEFNKKEADK